MASFLLKGTKRRALIDSSGPENAPNMLNRLKKMNLIPDILILTHSHWDHAGGTQVFQDGINDLKVFAGQSAIKALNNFKKYNEAFSPFSEDLEAIESVEIVKEGDQIELGDLNLTIYETPGHTDCSISIFDQKNKNLIIGDSSGYLWTTKLIMPPVHSTARRRLSSRLRSFFSISIALITLCAFSKAA